MSIQIKTLPKKNTENENNNNSSSNHENMDNGGHETSCEGMIITESPMSDASSQIFAKNNKPNVNLSLLEPPIPSIAQPTNNNKNNTMIQNNKINKDISVSPYQQSMSFGSHTINDEFVVLP